MAFRNPLKSLLIQGSQLDPTAIDGMTLHNVAITTTFPLTCGPLTINGDLIVNGSAWAPWTPALTAATTNPTLGAGSSATGKYLKMGRTVIGWGQVRFGTSGTNAGSGIYSVSIPVGRVTAQLYGVAGCLCNGVSTQNVLLQAGGASSFQPRYCTAAVNGVAVNLAHNAPGPWGTDDYINYWFAYESSS